MLAALLLILGVLILVLSLSAGFGFLAAAQEEIQRGLSGVLGSVFSILIIAKAIEWLLPDFVKRCFAWVLRKLPCLPRALQRRAMKNEVEGNLNAVLQDFRTEGQGIAPYPARLVWTSGESLSADSFFRQGRVTIILDYSENPDRNIAEAGLLYCREGLIPETRQYVEPPLLRAIDLTFVDALLERRNLTAGRFYFINEIVPREYEKSPSVRPHFERLDALEEKGYFSRILLPELRDYPGRVAVRMAHRSHQDQINDFVHFLAQNATYWDQGGLVALDHVRELIRVGVIIVGTESKLRVEGLRPYVKRIATCGDMGARDVYLVGTELGARAIPQIVEEAVRRGLAPQLKIQSYNALRRGKVQKWRVARLEIPEGTSRKFLDEFPEMRDWPDLELG